MKALQLARQYWEETAEPALMQSYPMLLPKVAAGLAGNGSECFGYDDEQSMDHDWGVDFFLWVRQSEKEIIPVLQHWKRELFAQHPPAYQRTRSSYGGLVDVMSIDDFYASMIGCTAVPDDLLSWTRAPESQYALATNGAVFWDGAGDFTAIRQGLLDYYPEDLRRKKIAARCMAIAQLGQYNFQRMVARGDWVTVHTVLDRFMREAIGLTYHLNRTYRPYYKWTWRRMHELPVLGCEIAERLLRMTMIKLRDEPAVRETQLLIDEICRQLGGELHRQALSDYTGSFFAGHGEAVQRTIQDERLRRLPPQYDPAPMDSL